MTRYTFNEVAAALDNEWKLSLHQGGAMGAGEHNDRCALVDVVSSRYLGVTIKRTRPLRSAS